ncbi:transposase, IS5 family protein [Cupriavidus basilensis OR16]|uniref:Transposase, IS5 family protein n=1 Tax=Cupriavidus basilensis OR16 TaxID=1127483 RepID=H1SHP2_9BURK|nr:transposase, IS5 family protein [Cupriavidus basilensis OR16]
MRQVMARCLRNFDQLFVLSMVADSLTRMRRLGQIRS